MHIRISGTELLMQNSGPILISQGLQVVNLMIELAV